ncbi:MAG: hypothetical protein DRI34_04235 [Deltaproteobacteria bacterium]|nr:MAG: hypothetical protein DRI34_04235 [Deltaproteobacteria bacterium]
MEKFYAAVQKLPLVQKVAFLVFVVAMLIGGHYFLIFQDQQGELKKLDRQIKKLDDERQEKQEIAANLSTFTKMVEFLKQKLAEKNKNLPENTNMDQLLKTLNEISLKSDIRIVKFVPLKEVRRNFYAEIPVAMSLEGNYHEVLTFFDSVGKEDRIINITNITMKDPSMQNGKIVLKVDCQAKTFRMLRENELHKKPAKGRKKRGKAGRK